MTEEEYAEAVDMLNEMVQNCGGDRPDTVHMNVKAVYDAVSDLWLDHEDIVMEEACG